jgi:hypothetical protein
MFMPIDEQIDPKFKMTKMKGYKVTFFPANVCISLIINTTGHNRYH